MWRPQAGVRALLLAAGESTRMGQPKQVLPWRGQPLVAYQVEQLQAAGAADVIVVVGHAADIVTPVAEASGARVVFNPDYRNGRAGSIRMGAAAIADDTHAVITISVDQPRTAALIRRVLDAHLNSTALITTPEHGGRRGHPVIFDGSLLPELRAVTEQQEGLRAVVRRHGARRQIVPVNDAGIHVEFNTPLEYEAALAADARRSERVQPL
jgi:molybdenum cofactor cytidylyltransferase